MFIGRISSVLDLLRHSHPMMAAIIESVFNLMSFGLLGYVVFIYLSRGFRAFQFSVYRSLLKRIQGKKASRKVVSKHR
jgi:hypothetical protein